jgi:hypothetical protein
MRTQDVLAWRRVLAHHKEVALVAFGEAAIPALHAAALEPGTFGAVTLRQMVPSWEDIVRTPETLNQAVNVVHGALQHYDLPDLVELAGADRVRLLEPSSVIGRPIK